MKLSRKFVSDYIEIPVDNHTLAEDMTKIGNEYDSEGKLLPATNLIIGKIISTTSHPNSDHLHICQVDIGTEILQIICGAPNVREEMKVIVALVGAILPNGIIKRTTIRGIESNGMLCSLAELGIEHKFLKDQDIEGICELPAEAPLGKDPISYLGFDDEIIDFALTSNRGDLFSIIGMAYEIGAIYDKKVKNICLNYEENEEDIKNYLTLEIKTEACPLFLARRVENVTIKESPNFIKERLIASGIRPINNVVDISNYVMLETGQPLHYYDADRLGAKLGVRLAQEGEKLITLDSNERILSRSDIVIYNNDGIVGLAGIMGGLSTEVEDDTKNIIIESAIFDPILIRKTSKKVLRSEASTRFEKGLDPNRTYMAMERSLHLLEKYANATIVKGMLEHKNITISDKTIKVAYQKINNVLGIDLRKETILDIFRRLGFTAHEETADYLLVTVPTRRIDIATIEDLIEEVGRIYGIDNIIGKTMTLPLRKGKYDKSDWQVKNLLSSLGLSETLTYSLIKDSEVAKYTADDFESIKILDPMTEDRNTLRYSLIPSLMMIYDYNHNRQNIDINIFEIGKGYYRKEKDYFENKKLAILMSGNYYLSLGNNKKVNFYILKGVIEKVLNYLGYNNRYEFINRNIPQELHPGQSASILIGDNIVGLLGRVHPNISKEDLFVAEINLDLLKKIKTSKMKYREISKFPSIIMDASFIVDNNIDSQTIIKTIKKAGGKLLDNVVLFDLYKNNSLGINKKSLAFKLIFKDPTKTLTDDEIALVFNKIVKELQDKYQALLRDS